MSRSAAASRVMRRPIAAPEPDAVRYGPLANWVGFHLRLAQTASFAAFAREVQDVDLSPGRFATLALIKENPGISQTTLSRANGRDKSTLTPVLDDLVRRNLVRRARTEVDRRSYALSLTPSGEKMLARLMDCARRHDANLDRIIGSKDRAMFLRVLQRIAVEI